MGQKNWLKDICMPYNIVADSGWMKAFSMEARGIKDYMRHIVFDKTNIPETDIKLMANAFENSDDCPGYTGVTYRRDPNSTMCTFYTTYDSSD